MKKTIKLFVIIIGVLLISACGTKESKTNDAKKFKEEYESLNGGVSSSGKDYLEVEIDEDNKVKYSSIKDIIKVLESGTGVIYLGYPECPWCRNVVPVLMRASNNTGIENVYYLNMHDVRDKMEVDSNGNVVTVEEGKEGYKDLLEKLDSILSEYTVKDDDGKEYDTGEKRIFVPTVIFVKNGKILDYHMDTVESQTDPYVGLNEEQEMELYDIYVKGIHKILGDQCDDDSEEHC